MLRLNQISKSNYNGTTDVAATFDIEQLVAQMAKNLLKLVYLKSFLKRCGLQDVNEKAPT